MLKRVGRVAFGVFTQRDHNPEDFEDEDGTLVEALDDGFAYEMVDIPAEEGQQVPEVSPPDWLVRFYTTCLVDDSDLDLETEQQEDSTAELTRRYSRFVAMLQGDSEKMAQYKLIAMGLRDTIKHALPTTP